MPALPPISPTTVSFVGGPYDGLVAKTDEADQERAAMARIVFLVSEGGTKSGAMIQGMSPAAMEAIERESYQGEVQAQQHRYRLVESRNEAGRLHLRVEYVEEASAGGP